MMAAACVLMAPIGRRRARTRPPRRRFGSGSGSGFAFGGGSPPRAPVRGRRGGVRADGEKRAPPRRQGARFAPREPRFARVRGPACPLRRPAAASIDRGQHPPRKMIRSRGRMRGSRGPDGDGRQAPRPAAGARRIPPAARRLARSLTNATVRADGCGGARLGRLCSPARSLAPAAAAGRGRRSVCRAFTRSGMWLFPAEPFTSTPLLPWLGPRPPPAQTGGGAAARPPHLAQEGKGASTAGGGGCGSPPSLQRGGEGRGGGEGGGGG